MKSDQNNAPYLKRLRSPSGPGSWEDRMVRAVLLRASERERRQIRWLSALAAMLLLSLGTLAYAWNERDNLELVGDMYGQLLPGPAQWTAALTGGE